MICVLLQPARNSVQITEANVYCTPPGVTAYTVGKRQIYVLDSMKIVTLCTCLVLLLRLTDPSPWTDVDTLYQSTEYQKNSGKISLRDLQVINLKRAATCINMTWYSVPRSAILRHMPVSGYMGVGITDLNPATMRGITLVRDGSCCTPSS